MTKSVAYIVTGKTITLYMGGTPRSVEEDHPFYARIVQCLKDEEYSELEELLTNPVAGVAEFVDGEVVWSGKVLHNVLVDRIMEQVAIGLSPDPMLRFLENLMQNPSEKSREELYEFLAHSYLPITEDGHFLGYKAVRSNYLDIHSGVYDNSPGKVIEMARTEVDPDRHNHCSQGFHVGTMQYVSSFGHGDSKFLLVKVNPRDAVSVPADHGAQKLRCCRYEVVQEIARNEVLKGSVYSSDGSCELDADRGGGDWDEDDYDDDWDADDYDDWGYDSDDDLPSQEDVGEFKKARAEYYDATFTRDWVAKECHRLGLTKTVEAGRVLRKEGCIALLVGHDTKSFFDI